MASSVEIAQTIEDWLKRMREAAEKEIELENKDLPCESLLKDTQVLLDYYGNNKKFYDEENFNRINKDKNSLGVAIRGSIHKKLIDIENCKQIKEGELDQSKGPIRDLVVKENIGNHIGNYINALEYELR